MRYAQASIGTRVYSAEPTRSPATRTSQSSAAMCARPPPHFALPQLQFIRRSLFSCRSVRFLQLCTVHLSFLLLVRIGPSRGPAVRVGVGRRVPRNHQSGAHSVPSPLPFSFLFSLLFFFFSSLPSFLSLLLCSCRPDTIPSTPPDLLCLRDCLLFFLNPLAVRSAQVLFIALTMSQSERIKYVKELSNCREAQAALHAYAVGADGVLITK